MAELSGLNPVVAAQTLLMVGGREDEAPEILRSAGTSLAPATESGAAVSEFDMRDRVAVPRILRHSWKVRDVSRQAHKRNLRPVTIRGFHQKASPSVQLLSGARYLTPDVCGISRCRHARS